MAASSVPSIMKAWQYSSFEGGADALKVRGKHWGTDMRNHTPPSPSLCFLFQSQEVTPLASSEGAGWDGGVCGERGNSSHIRFCQCAVV